MNRKNILANIWKPSATKAVTFMLLLPLVGSLFVIGSFYLYLKQTDDDVLFTNVAGRQRMLAVQLGTYAHMVHDMGQDDDREPLRELVATFDQSLVALEQGGAVMGRRLSPAPPELRNNINLVKKLWQDLKPALVLVVEQSEYSPQAQKAYNLIRESIPLLRAMSNDIVLKYELFVQNKKMQIFRTLIAVLSINFILVFTGIMIIRSFLNERKQAEAQVKKLSEIVEKSPDMAFITDPNSKIEYVNPAFEKITGYSKEEAVGQTPRILKSEKMSDKYYKRMWDTISSGKLIHAEVINRKKNGELFIYDQTITPLKNADGNITNFISTGLDITERVESRNMLEKALEKAEKANRVKSLFLANMSHEIRTPLNAIMGFTEMIEISTRNLVGDEEKEFFNAIKSSGNRLLRTVHEILDISQIEARTYELEMEQLDLCKMVEALVKECQLIANENNLNFEYKSEIDSAFIQADQYGVSQAIHNIIDNAIKYTEQGKVTVLLKQSSEQYMLSIQDTGIGISKEYIDSLYTVFSQESEGYSKKYQGIGLGMAIAKRQLDLNNVEMNVESIKGVGTIFTLTFERVVEKNVELKEKPADKKVSKTAEKPLVLLVDNDPSSQKLTELFLKDSYNICFAVSVKEAKEQLKKYPVGLVILDLVLVENEDGLDLVRWMRKTKTWQKTPVIATVAHAAFTTDRDKCITSGCNGCLTKPIKREKILEKISKFV